MNVSAETLRPIRLLILALGGEGGGVLADWLVDAFTEAGYPVQGTSVPGVAQRTGATSYYIEFLNCHQDRLAGAEPVFCLSPSPGQIDVLVSSELLETARAIERGFVDPLQTTLITSTSRFLTVHEKMQMGDGRFDDERALAAARTLSKQLVLFDMMAAASRAGTVLSAVMFGALAGSGCLPLSKAQCEAMIAKAGRGTEASLRGFAAGFDEAQRQLSVAGAGAGAASAAAAGFVADDETAVRTIAPPIAVKAGTQSVSLPAAVAKIAQLAADRLVDYQDAAYAQSYLQRVQQFVTADQSSDYAASRTAARFLALWMSYEDVIRVADLKTRAERFKRIRADVGARGDEPIVVRDFLKPGVEEVAAILPAAMASPLLAWAKRKGIKTFSDGIQWRTNSITGLLGLRLMAKLRAWRRRSSRFAFEQQLIERWSKALLSAMAIDPRLALEVAECPRLIKGYGDTFNRGQRNFVEILTTLIEPAVTTAKVAADKVSAVRRAREAALADPEGRELAKSLGKPAPLAREHPIKFVQMKRPTV